jgi:subtilase family serine protease
MNATLHGFRGVPDVAYNAGVVGGVIVAYSEPFGPGAFFLFGGTSSGAPQLAGIVADLAQGQGGNLGFINPQLYNLGGNGQLKRLTHDVTVGDNGLDGVPGYPAVAGYDLSTGWGTPNFSTMKGSMLKDNDGDSN